MSAPDAPETAPTRSELPRLVVVADRFTSPDIAERTERAVEAGVPWIHLRDHAASDEVFEQAARALLRTVSQVRSDVLVSINSRPLLASGLGTGLHVGVHCAPWQEVYAREDYRRQYVGYSVHSVEQGEDAVRQGAQYLFMSPIFPTGSKPGHEGIGLEGLRAFVEAFPDSPVFALGGIEPRHVAAVREAGAYGVAVLSGILGRPDPAAAARAYLDELTSSTRPGAV